MSVLVRPVDPRSSEWGRLAELSHQTSLYVTPEWLEADRPMIIGAFDRGELVTGLVAHDVAEYPLGSPYQGLLLSAHSRPAATEALISWLEGVGGAPAVWNAPSMVDIRPFQERVDSGHFWATHIRYTFFTDRQAVDPLPESVEKTEERYARILGPKSPRSMRRCFEIDAVKFYENEDGGLVVWGEDLQGRGYFLAGDGRVGRLISQLINAYHSSDLNGTPEWARPFKPKLRTSYGLVMKP